MAFAVLNLPLPLRPLSFSPRQILLLNNAQSQLGRLTGALYGTFAECL